MSLLVDLLPILAFFITLKFTDVFVATAVAIAATIGGVIYQKVKKGRVEPMMLISGGLMLVFGGLTIALHDETFVKWKPTILMLLFGAALVASRFWGQRPLMQRALGKQFEADRSVWLRINDGFTAFCVLIAGLNLWVAYTFSTDTWATFKLFGLIGANIVAMIVAVWYLQRRGRIIGPGAPPSEGGGEQNGG